MKKLPIGISTLSQIIDDDYVYIDKTADALKLIDTGKYYFLSRPRRFGKSLLLDTLKEIFSGNRELFKGLYIYDKWNWEQQFPVIHINLGSGDYSTAESVKEKLFHALKINADTLGVSYDPHQDPLFCFQDLIINAQKKYQQKVVILIDEYDKPILDNIENPTAAKVAREILKNFYGVIKDSDAYLQFAFLTGVSKFSKVSLFSGLNNLNDITVDKNYSTICGYTQHDVETSFAEHLHGQDFDKIRTWYNGYKWLGEGVYNPFDILLFIQKGFVYSNYWFSTATPTFLLKLIAKNNYFLPDLENVVADSSMLDSFDIDDIRLEILMWQTGYLTIANSQPIPKGEIYFLAIPNKEVEISLLGHIADSISKISNSARLQNAIYQAFATANQDAFQQQLTALFAAIPYSNFTHNKMHEYEGYYVSVFYAYMKALGIELIAEDITNKGRIDLTMKLPHAIYICEFKSDGTNALAQIKARRYHEKYLNEAKQLYLIGIEFDTAKRNVSKVEWEKV